MALRSPEELEPSVRKKKEYAQGQEAFEREMTIEDCPHVKGARKIAWLAGYYDARTYSRLGHIFRKYRLRWPE